MNGHGRETDTSYPVGGIGSAWHEFVEPFRKHPSSPFRSLFGYDIDDSADFNTEKDGYSPFNALATFALAQGAALTAVARGEGRDKIVLSIYAIAVVLTICWIRAMLRATKTVPDGQRPLRAYDAPTIRYGRWVQLWTLILSVILFVLGTLELLPNQTPRIPYDRGTIWCDAWAIADRPKVSGGRQGLMDKWIEWLSRSASGGRRQQLLWIESKSPFPASYKPFVVTLRCNADYAFGERVAFLVKDEPGEYRPTYRQIWFQEEGVSTTDHAELEIIDAARDERVVILTFAGNPNQDAQPSADLFRFRLVPHFENRPASP